MNYSDLAQRAAAIKWWHGGIDLGQGVITRGQVDPAVSLLPRIDLPADLTGKTVLDVGTWDGYMAFECERRGAARVVATDSFCWGDELAKIVPGSTGRAGFDLAHEALDSKVEPVECDLLNLSPRKLGKFDIVLFLGVLYHMRNPLLALERVAAMAKDVLIVESYVISQYATDVPMMRFYPGRELNDDPSNWWGPNVACVSEMIRNVGFEVTSVRLSVPGLSRATFHARKVL